MFVFPIHMQSETYAVARIGRCLPRALTLATTLILVGGCAQAPAHYPVSRTVTVPLHRPVARDPVLSLLAYARKLNMATAQKRETAVENARKAVHKTPSGMHYARLALALGTPHQRLYTPDDAARYAGVALTCQDAHWSPAAKQYLGDYKRLYSDLSNDSDDNTAAQTGTDDSRRIARLQAELRDARHKLRALAHIEDSLDTVNTSP